MAGIGVPNPDHGELAAAGQLLAELLGSPATKNAVDGDRMDVDDIPLEHGVQRRLAGRPGVRVGSADYRVVHGIQDVRLAPGVAHLADLLVVQQVKQRRHGHRHIASLRAHVAQAGARGLDVHPAPVGAFDAGVAAAGLDEPVVAADIAADLYEFEDVGVGFPADLAHGRAFFFLMSVGGPRFDRALSSLCPVALERHPETSRQSQELPADEPDTLFWRFPVHCQWRGTANCHRRAPGATVCGCPGGGLVRRRNRAAAAAGSLQRSAGAWASDRGSSTRRSAGGRGRST